MNIVKSGRARAKIKQWLQKEDREKKKEEGTDLLEKACRLYNTSIKTLKKVGDDKFLVEKLNAANFGDLLIQIGSGKLDIKSIIEQVPSLKIYRRQLFLEF